MTSYMDEVQAPAKFWRTTGAPKGNQKVKSEKPTSPIIALLAGACCLLSEQNSVTLTHALEACLGTDDSRTLAAVRRWQDNREGT